MQRLRKTGPSVNPNQSLVLANRAPSTRAEQPCQHRAGSVSAWLRIIRYGRSPDRTSIIIRLICYYRKSQPNSRRPAGTVSIGWDFCGDLSKNFTIFLSVGYCAINGWEIRAYVGKFCCLGGIHIILANNFADFEIFRLTFGKILVN
jgi:hypothetical protein